MELTNINEKKFSREDFGVLSFWAWNEGMDDKSIKERIGEFKEQGFHGFFMHSRAGLLTPYLSDEWFHACKTAALCAKELGMEAWIYDEDGWPSGFAGGRVPELGDEYQSKYIIISDKREEIDQKHLLAAFAKTSTGYQKVEYQKGDIWFCYANEPNYVDLLSKEVTKKFIEITHERYKKELGELFGTTVPGFFTDEPQYNSKNFPYSNELEEYFIARNSYSFIDNLHMLLQDENSAASNKFHKDYWNTVEEMMRNHFSKQIFDWCEENHVQFTGHYPGEDSLIQQVNSTAGVMPKYQYMHMPGIDHLGRRITSILLTKQVTSAAKQFGKKKVLSETFGCAGWNISFEQMCHIWGWQAAAGINVACLHIGAHSIRGIRKRDYPAFYSYQEPWWDNFHHISAWLSGISYKMSLGRWMEDVLVLSPMESIYLYHNQKISNEEQMISMSYRQLLENLLDIQVGFDIGDETILRENAIVEENTLKVGKCSYKIVIVPKTITLEKNTWALLERFQISGGIVVFTEDIPKLADSFESYVSKMNTVVVQNRRGFWYKYFEMIRYQREVSVYSEDGFNIAPGLSVSIKEEEGILRSYIWNSIIDSNRQLQVRVLGNKAVYNVDAESFKRTQLYTNMDGEYTYVPLLLEKYESVLLEIEDGDIIKEYDAIYRIESLQGTVSTCNQNSLVIDYACFSFDGENYSDSLQIVNMHPILYQNLPKPGKIDIYIKYQFYNNMKHKPKLTACLEDKDCIDVICNDISVFHNKGDWFMDRGIYAYDITNAVMEGENNLVVVYHLPECDIKNVDGLFETEVNRFFYQVEPEAIYINGEFSVAIEGKTANKPTHIMAQVSKFQLQDKREITSMKSLTESGLWFYRGNVALETDILLNSKEQKFIKIQVLKAAFVEIKCNGQSKVAYMSPYCVDITDMLYDGHNHITIILHGTNRNILGPHHHIKGENNFVGVNTFKGTRGYEDSIVNYDLQTDNTWSDNYAFVEFGCNSIELITLKSE